ncbi:MAG TPA: ferritin-like domain-containing protein [Actinomycetes bacterium]|nr:ferritin-like domain-containing protein [Actinomycetes bacterium]
MGYYERNAADRMAIPWERGVQLPSALRRSLARSIQRFQVGESGDGAHLLRKAGRIGDPEYLAALRLFVAEEREHSRLLAGLLAALGVEPLRWHVTDAAFVALRRMLGLRLELGVLLMAEVVALRYYQALHEGTEDPVVRAVGRQILHDEQAHVPFHCDRLRRDVAGLPVGVRVALAGAWRLAFGVVCLVVAVDHGGALRGLGVPARTFLADAGQRFAAAADQALGLAGPSVCADG